MARRGENIYKRKDGRWEGRLRLEAGGGKTKLHSIYAPTYLEVKQKMRAFSTAESKDKSADSTVKYYAVQWLRSVKLRCKQSTYNKYSNICKNHIVSEMGNIKIGNLRCNDVYHMLSKRRQLAPKTLNDILCVLKMICSYAELDGAKHVEFKAVSLRVPKSAVQVLTIDEQQRLIQYLLADIDRIKLGVYLTICTGIRIGELCALRRNCIDLEHKILRIGVTMQRVQIENDASKTAVIITDPKSVCSVRNIPLAEDIAKILAAYIADIAENAFFLTGESDKYIEPCVMRYRFYKILSACGIRRIKFHALRHSFATRCVEAGVDIKTLSEILGHENVNITLNRYVHPSMELKRESIKKLSRSPAYLPSIPPSSIAQSGKKVALRRIFADDDTLIKVKSIINHSANSRDIYRVTDSAYCSILLRKLPFGGWIWRQLTCCFYRRTRSTAGDLVGTWAVIIPI